MLLRYQTLPCSLRHLKSALLTEKQALASRYVLSEPNPKWQKPLNASWAELGDFKATFSESWPRVEFGSL